MRQDIFQDVREVTKLLPKRGQDIIWRRFGIGPYNKETLESIGKDYGITRERVRQIEEAALQFLGRPEHYGRLSVYFKQLLKFIKEHGGVMAEDFLVERFCQTLPRLSQKSPTKEKGCILFLLRLGQKFERNRGSSELYPHWFVDQTQQQLMEKVLRALVKYFEKTAQALSFPGVLYLFKKSRVRLSEKAIISYLEISRLISQNAFGDFGLKEWAEINPRGVRDKAFLVLKKLGKPLHFTEVAEQIGKLGLSSRQALPQTAHNELIKDPRFVLIGRGTYALKEWGYEPGTVRDVLIQVLREKRRPQTQQVLVEEVLKRRQVKPNTVILNLHSNPAFKRLKNGKYTLRK